MSATRSRQAGILILFAGIIVTAAGILWHLLIEYRSIDHAARSRLTEQAQVLRVTLSRQISAADIVLRSICETLPKLYHLEDAQSEITNRLVIFRDSVPGIRTISLVDEEGRITVSSNPELVSRDIALRPYFALARQNGEKAGLIVSEPFVTTLGTYSIALARVAPKAKNGHMNLVVIILDPEYFGDLLESVATGEDGFAAIIHGDGSVFITAPAQMAMRGRNLLMPGSFFQAHRQSGAALSFSDGRGGFGEDRLTVSATITMPADADKPLVAVVSQNKSQVFAAWREHRRLELFLFLLLTLACGSVFVIVMRRDREVALVNAAMEAERNRRALSAAQEAKKFQTLLDAASDGVHVLDETGHILVVSKSFARMLGYEPEALIGKHVTFWDAKFSVDEIDRRLAALLETSQTKVFETLHRRRDGTTFEVELSTSALEIDGKKLLFNASRDITQRRQQEIGMRLAARVFSYAHEGILITDEAGTILDVNAMFSEVTGYSHDEAVGQNPRMLSSGLQGKDFYVAMWHALRQQGHWTGEVWNRRKNGEVYAEFLSISAIRDDRGKIRNFVGLFSDITEKKTHEQQLERTANYDLLTNLPNRQLLGDRLQQALTACQRRNGIIAVAYVDLDGFKEINDRFGHEQGDKSLVTIAERLKSALRESDTLARIGGDEFVVLLNDLDLVADSEPVLYRLLDAASEKIIDGIREIKLSASIGVATYPRDGSDADQLLRNADHAMYQAKQSGKNRFRFFDAEEDLAGRAHFEALEGIRKALEREEFVLFYQPKVDMRFDKVIGVEALIRWEHPERGLLAPAQFLPTIENHELSVDVGYWVIRAALRQMEIWRRQGLNLVVSVNVGARQLLEPDFFARLSDLLSFYPDMPRWTLEIEILETSALEDIEAVIALMEACHGLGVRFSIDDFGTGYSSLNYLKRLPAACLKIDQSFVRDMLEDQGDLAIVQGVVGLAKAFDREVIAEGVESVRHGDKLLTMGCHLAQGYGVAKPMAAGLVALWVNDWRGHPSWKQAVDRAA